MKKIASVTLIMILFLVVIVTVSFILGQDTKNIRNLTIKDDNRKNMKSLTVKNDLQKHGIEVISFSDKSFNDVLTQYVGNNEELISLVESSKPFSFFIKNNSKKEVVGISLRWEFVKPSGEIQEIPQSEANPGVLMGMKTLDPQMIGKTSLINSKAVKFLSYFNDIVGHKITFANMRLNNPSVNYKYHFDFEDIQRDISYLDSQKKNILSGATDISVSIDGIIFDDGTFAGKDQNFFFDSLRGAIQARKEVLTALVKAKSSGENDSNILDGLLSNISNKSVSYAELRERNASPERAFDVSYKGYLNSLRGEFVMQRSKMSDDRIIRQFQSVHVSDFVTLRKIDD